MFAEVDFDFFEDVAVAVGIEGGVMGEGEDGAGLRVHDHDLAAVGAVVFDGGGEDLVAFHLDAAVDGEEDVGAIHGGFEFAATNGDEFADGVAFALEAAFGALEEVFEGAFDAVLAGAGVVGVADDVSAKFLFGVVAEIFFFH